MEQFCAFLDQLENHDPNEPPPDLHQIFRNDQSLFPLFLSLAETSNLPRKYAEWTRIYFNFVVNNPGTFDSFATVFIERIFQIMKSSSLDTDVSIFIELIHNFFPPVNHPVFQCAMNMFSSLVSHVENPAMILRALDFANLFILPMARSSNPVENPFFPEFFATISHLLQTNFNITIYTKIIRIADRYIALLIPLYVQFSFPFNLIISFVSQNANAQVNDPAVFSAVFESLTFLRHFLYRGRDHPTEIQPVIQVLLPLIMQLFSDHFNIFPQADATFRGTLVFLYHIFAPFIDHFSPDLFLGAFHCLILTDSDLNEFAMNPEIFYSSAYETYIDVSNPRSTALSIFFQDDYIRKYPAEVISALSAIPNESPDIIEAKLAVLMMYKSSDGPQFIDFLNSFAQIDLDMTSIPAITRNLTFAHFMLQLPPLYDASMGLFQQLTELNLDQIDATARFWFTIACRLCIPFVDQIPDSTILLIFQNLTCAFDQSGVDVIKAWACGNTDKLVGIRDMLISPLIAVAIANYTNIADHSAICVFESAIDTIASIVSLTPTVPSVDVSRLIMTIYTSPDTDITQLGPTLTLVSKAIYSDFVQSEELINICLVSIQPERTLYVDVFLVPIAYFIIRNKSHLAQMDICELITNSILPGIRACEDQDLEASEFFNIAARLVDIGVFSPEQLQQLLNIAIRILTQPNIENDDASRFAAQLFSAQFLFHYGIIHPLPPEIVQCLIQMALSGAMVDSEMNGVLIVFFIRNAPEFPMPPFSEIPAHPMLNGLWASICVARYPSVELIGPLLDILLARVPAHQDSDVYE